MNGRSCRTSKPLVVRTVRVVTARSRTSESTVHCPARDRAISAAECLACRDCDGAVSRPDGRVSLRCAHPTAERAAFAELMRQPLFAEGADDVRLADVMTTDVVCVGADLEVDHLVDLLVERHV